MTPSERYADFAGIDVRTAEHTIGVVRGKVGAMVAAGKIVRRDGAQGLPSDDEIADGLIKARALIEGLNEVASEREGVRASVYADGRAPVPEMPRMRRGVRA